jgi:Tfp pilus assembly protein PilN
MGSRPLKCHPGDADKRSVTPGKKHSAGAPLSVPSPTLLPHHMRAVNLLPSDLRGTAPAASPSARPEPAEGIGAYVVLGALALCVALVAVYVLATNTVKQKQSDLAAITVKADATAQKVAQLKPYADFDALAKARVETVRGLAAARFDWEQALRDLSRVIPGDVKLQTINGDMGLPGTTGSGGDPLRGSIQAPAVSLTGCAATQQAVAHLMSRLRGVDGVTRVSLSKSERPSDAGGNETSACVGDNPPNFSAVVFFEGSAAAAALASTGGAVDTASVPVPAAIDKAATTPQDGSAATPQDGTAAAPQDPAGTTPTNTTTSTSGAAAP